jgi:hypothetical protein
MAGDRERFAAIAGRLDWLAAVPNEVLAGVVTRDGLCFRAFRRGDVPAMTGQDTADRELAASLCAGCPVVRDAAGVFTHAEDKLWSEIVLARLIDRWPDRYTGWTRPAGRRAQAPRGRCWRP